MTGVDQLWLFLPVDTWHQLATILFLMVILVPAALGDYQQQTIPNWLSMSGWVIGPLMSWLILGQDAMYGSLQGLGIMFAVFFPLWLLHWFGAADVKLMASVGALVGVTSVWPVLIGVLAAGMVISLYMMIRHVFRRSATHSAEEGDERGYRGIVIPYAIPIAFGTMLTILYIQIQALGV